MTKFTLFLERLLLFTTFSLLSFSTAFAQDGKGKIAGKIIDKALSEDLIGVTVKIVEASTGAITDFEGKFIIPVNPGTYTMECTYASYQTEKIEGVVVKANEVSFVNVVLSEAVSQIAEVVIVAKSERSSMTATMIERRNAPQVSDGISADIIRRTPDRTTSDVLKRVTGASIQEGKFAVIRGMNDRYNIGFLDGALLPSTEADRKAFAFDVVPAALIDNLQIIKAGSPDMLGDFGGGIIRITTKAVPEEFSQNISIGGQVHSLTHFKDFAQFKRYGGEALNFISSQRDLPDFPDRGLTSASAFPSAAERMRFSQISQQFNNDWENNTITAPINTRLAYSLGMPIFLKNNAKIGLIFALNYSNTRRFAEGAVNSFDGSGQVAKFKDLIYLNNTTNGGIFNLNYVGTKTQINFRNLINLNSDNNTTRRSGDANLIDGLQANNFINIINHNRLQNSVISLKQIVGDNLFMIDATANYSNVRRRIPDYRIVNYTLASGDNEYSMALGDFFNSSTGRFSSDLEESLIGGELNLSKQFDAKRTKTTLKTGGFFQRRERSFAGRSFVYGGNPSSRLAFNPQTDLAQDKIGEGGLFLSEKTGDDLGYYNGESTLAAFYAMADQKFFDKLRAVYGVRYENADIYVFNERTARDVARVKQNVFLPSANFSYSLTEKANLRLAYYRSVNRPEFRELAPFAFFVFDKNADIKGNPNLKIANINNLELRYEYYPSGNQIVSLGGFYKNITNPVEFNIDITQPFTTFTFANEQAANVYGLEFEVRKNLDFIGKSPILENFVVYSNLALIRSSLEFALGSQATPDRPLQGQSPYVLNAGLQYDDRESGWSGSLTFNRIGRRIAFVGVDKQFAQTRQDIYENPRSVIDFQLSKSFGKLNLKLTLGDILRQNLVFYQDINADGDYNEGGDLLMFQFNNGFTTSLSASYSF